jgi:type I restriction-modification system DNA methylase subunit
MSSKALTNVERAALNLILEDLRFLFDKEEIRQEEIDNVLNNLKSDEVRSYIQNLRFGSKPETALRESFIAGKSILLKYLFGEAIPEVRSDGFIDYLIKDEMGRGIMLELKPLFEAEVEFDKAGKPVLKRLRQVKIVPKSHQEQILKYIQEGEAQFVVLTNLREWFFYSKELTPKEVKPFCSIDFFELVKEYDVISNLRDYLERKEFESIRYELDKRFLESLKTWVKKLSEVEFTVDEKRKLELIIGLINKFIFVQTLDDYGVIEFNWIRKRWNHHERMWQRKSKVIVLEKFFDELDEWFNKYYDTELFREKILQYIKREPENMDKFYRNLQLVLGLTYLQTPLGAIKGIMQYNFRHIDEDVLGKAYETFLGEVRKEEGIYYTPKYITQYIAENTVDRVFDELLIKIREKMEKKEFEDVKNLVSRFTSIKVLDPACGSGSFLIKTIRIINEKYKELNQLIGEHIKRYGSKLSKEDVVKTDQLEEIKRMIGSRNGRELIGRILVRHIHGVDLDKRALEVAKVNIWLEALKLAPKEFRYDQLPAETNYILPALEINLCNGDSIFGLPEEMTISFLRDNFRADIIRLFELWKSYVDNPIQPELVEEIEKIKQKLRKELDGEFRKYLDIKRLSHVFDVSKSFYWALEFWHFFFDMSGNPLPENERGADIVLGNPPYERIQVLRKKSPTYVNYLDNSGFHAVTKNYDLAVIFIERGVKLLKEMGEFGYIVTNKFIQADYGEGIRDYLSEGSFIRELIDFGDQQVFDDATTYTCLLFIKKTRNQTFKYAIVKKLEGTLEQLVRINTQEFADEKNEKTFLIEVNRLEKTPWIFADKNEQLVASKTGALKTLDDIKNRIFQGLVTGADPVFILELKEKTDGLIKVYSHSMNKEYILESELIRPLLKGQDIKKWVVKEYNEVILFPYLLQDGKAVLIPPNIFQVKYPHAWEYLLDNKNYLEMRERGKWKGVANWYAYSRRQNLEQFDQPKIMTQVLASRASFALDLGEKLYFVGGGNAGGYGITIKPIKNLSLQYVCALLNSVLLDWHLKKSSSRFRGGFYSYARRFLEKLPIKIPETKVECTLTQKIEQSVNKILQLKKAQYVLLQQWIAWSTKLKTDEQSLEKILTQDRRNLREGATQELWISKVSFYPPERAEILNKTYSNFRIIGDRNQPSIRIFGIDEDNNEEQIYELEFEDRDLMLHFYHSLMQTLESRVKIKTLSQLFAKTMIPIVMKVNESQKELTRNIMKRVKEEFEKWKVEKRMTDINPDIVNIVNEVNDAEAEIDALVFKLYGLQENGINTIFNSLKTSPMYQAKVLEIFKRL